MKTYDVIAIGSGSATNVIDTIVQREPGVKIALIDKDEPGGICLTRGCIPSKILLYPAELIRSIERSLLFGIDLAIRNIDFGRVMERMRTAIRTDIDEIRESLSHHPNIDYYREAAEFTAPYTMKLGEKEIKADLIFLCTGSKPLIPPIKGLEETGYLTSDTVLGLSELPKSMVIIGGGYIAAEYGHFFSAMGSRVTIVGRNARLLPDEEPEISAVAHKKMSDHMTLFTGFEVLESARSDSGGKIIVARAPNGQEMKVEAQEILVASGRASNTDILHPERAGINTRPKGWIVVNDYLETSQPNIWAFGDATGRYLFKHKANYESVLVYQNAVLGRKVKADYHAIPHAIFSSPEIASVGMKEREALQQYGQDRLLIGLHLFEKTGKGLAMALKDFFVKVIVQADRQKILGAHIIGPQASLLIQEIITTMYTPEQSYRPISGGMHIHPALSEVVERAFQSLMSPAEYRHVLKHSLDLG